MNNPFRRETLRSPLPPSAVVTRLRGSTVALESILNRTAPWAGYGVFLKESFVGDKAVVAKIENDRFRLMPIGIWPVKGDTPLASAGPLFGTIEAEGDGSRVACWYRIPLLWTVFVSVFLLTACLVTPLLTWVVITYPRIEGRGLLVSFIVGLPAFVIVFGGYWLVGAWHQSNILRRFLREQFGK